MFKAIKSFFGFGPTPKSERVTDPLVVTLSLDTEEFMRDLEKAKAAIKAMPKMPKAPKPRMKRRTGKGVKAVKP